MSLLLLLIGGQVPSLPSIITHTSSVDANGVALPSLRGVRAGISVMMPSATISRHDGDAAIVTERRASAEVNK